MIKEKMLIWKREYDLPVQFECYPGENVLPTQEEALKKLIHASKHEFDVAEQKVKQYLAEQNPDVFPENEVANIFCYVVPKSIYVPHIREHCIAAVLCYYRLDLEHGLALVFEDGKFQSVGPEDVVL